MIGVKLVTSKAYLNDSFHGLSDVRLIGNCAVSFQKNRNPNPESIWIDIVLEVLYAHRGYQVSTAILQGG